MTMIQKNFGHVSPTMVNYYAPGITNVTCSLKIQHSKKILRVSVALYILKMVKEHFEIAPFLIILLQILEDIYMWKLVSRP